MNNPSQVVRYSLLAAGVWLAIVYLSLWVHTQNQQAQTINLATNTARANFDKDQAYRRWASSHGGVYVPPDERTPPSPFLSHVPRRDITTSDGQQLTLMNPAYMLRQMMSEFSEQYGIKGHITGVVYLNPNNAPDEWEKRVLKQFEAGVKEVMELDQIEGKEYLRLMRPMIMEQSCMKCHGHLGIPVGAIRGGVSVSVPMASYRAEETHILHTLYWQYGFITLIGLIAILMIALRSQRHLVERQRVLKELTLNAQVFSNGLDGILITDAKGVILRVNPMFSEITGFKPEEVVGQRPSVLKSHRHPPEFYQELWQKLLNNDRWEGEIWNRRKNGEGFSVWENISTVRDGRGEIVYLVGMFRDITEQKRHRERIHYLAHYDLLTELPNRTLMLDRLDHAIAVANRNQTEVALLFIDLDSFKIVNDSMGHPTGDELLKIVAERLQELIRDADTVARLGGDEFILILEDPNNNEGVHLVVERILSSLATPVQLAGREFVVNASIGVSIYPKDGESADELLKNADTAMYRAKEQGRARCSYYDVSMSEKANQRFYLEAQLRQAINLNQLRLVYQPQIHLLDHSPCGVEALIRWSHPEQGEIMPADFIPLAEESGLIHPIGAWVLKRACSDAMRWLQRGTPLRVSVNVSSHQFAQGELLAQVGSALQESGLPAELLELEITESVMLDNLERSTEMLAALKARGVTIALDDFGTGYSSLSYLKRLAVDRLKIDRSFVLDLGEEEDNDIAKLIVQVASLLKLTVIAEGIETVTQLRRLKGMQCNEGQGFLIARPLERERFEAWLAGEGRTLGMEEQLGSIDPN